MIDYITQLRGRLWRRVDRLRSASPVVYHGVAVQFWNWLHRETFLHSLVVQLASDFPNAREFAEQTFAGKTSYGLPDENEQAAYGYNLLLLCVRHQDSDNEERIGSANADYMPGLRGEPPPSCLEAFTFVFVEPLAIWLDEKLESNQLIQRVLLRYRERSEWFRREVLRERLIKGEEALVLDLLEYLFDQGIDVFLEPLQRCGRPDLVSVTTGPEAFVADGKVYRGEGPAKVGKYVRQVYDYLCERNRSSGYLVIFKECEQDLRFTLPVSLGDVSFLVHNNKRISFLVVNLWDDLKSASRRSRIEFHEVTEADLVRELNEPSKVSSRSVSVVTLE